MKNLLEYIKESLLDDFDNLSDAIDPREEIKRFLNDTYFCHLAWAADKLFTISKKPNKDGLYLVDALSGSWIEVKDSKKKSLEYITNGIFVFNKVEGGLSLRNCINLKSLEGAPQDMYLNHLCVIFAKILNHLKALLL